VLISARRVGPTGRAIGLDMTFTSRRECFEARVAKSGSELGFGERAVDAPGPGAHVEEAKANVAEALGERAR
jgi:hypothetical protein